LRAPINTILTVSGQLLPRVRSEHAQMVKVCQASCRFLLELIQDVFDLSKIVMDQFQLKAEWFSIASVFQELREIMEVNFQLKGVQLLFETDPFLEPLLYSDPKRLKQILLNLISNALKFTSKGRVKVSVKRTAMGQMLAGDESDE